MITYLETVESVERRMTAAGLKDRQTGAPLRGLEAVPFLFAELNEDQKRIWHRAETSVLDAMAMGMGESSQPMQEVLASYRTVMCGLVDRATTKIRHRMIRKEIAEQSFCAREER